MIKNQNTIYICRIDRDITAEQEEKLMNIISFEKAERLKRYRHRDDILRGLTAEILLRYVLEKNSISTGKFIKNKYGKLYDEQGRFYFNISHSADYTALIFGKSENGIDIEKISEGYTNLYERVLMKSEHEMLLNTEDSLRDEFFMRCWTAKEAYLKYVGKGISEGMRNVGLEFYNGFRLIGMGKDTQFFSIFKYFHCRSRHFY